MPQPLTIALLKAEASVFARTESSHDGNVDDVLAFFSERMLPIDDIQARPLAEEVLRNPPEMGYLTISNALQWRLQYSRVIQQAGTVNGVENL